MIAVAQLHRPAAPLLLVDPDRARAHPGLDPQDLSLANPVEWAVRAAREPVLPATAWGDVGVFLLALLGFALATALRDLAFRAYQRTL